MFQRSVLPCTWDRCDNSPVNAWLYTACRSSVGFVDIVLDLSERLNILDNGDVCPQFSRNEYLRNLAPSFKQLFLSFQARFQVFQAQARLASVNIKRFVVQYITSLVLYDGRIHLLFTFSFTFRLIFDCFTIGISISNLVI